MRIAVIGVGGVGGFFGGMLSAQGHEVALIARGEHLAAIRASGLHIKRWNGDDVVVKAAIVTDDPRSVGPVDYVLLGVKAWQVREAARAAAPLVDRHTAVVPLQNGIEACDEVAGELGSAHAVGATIRIISVLTGPGRIEHRGVLPIAEIGELDLLSASRSITDASARAPRLTALCDALDAIPGVTAILSSNIRAAMWSKFLFTCAWSGVAAVVRAPVGVIRALPQTRHLLEQAMNEIERVATASGVELPADIVGRTMAYLDSMPPQGTTSMQRDILEARPSELDSLCGAVIRAGRRAAIPTPLHEFLYGVLLPHELRTRGDLAPTLEPTWPRD